MAQKVRITLVSDLSDTEIPEGGGETVQFALDGASYEIDLTDDEGAGLREALAPYIEAGRRVGGSRRRRSSSSPAASSNGSGPSAAEIRAWAKDAGHDVPDRGRIPGEVREAYAAAH